MLRHIENLQFRKKQLADPLSPDERSAFMARIRGKNTHPEMMVRRVLHRCGYRFRVHYSGLPGRPDIVFPNRRKAVFVHGCFWHDHSGCVSAHVPKTRPEYWRAKFEGNKLRDARNLEKLGELGWDALVLWECEISDVAKIESKLKKFLGATVNKKKSLVQIGDPIYRSRHRANNS